MDNGKGREFRVDAKDEMGKVTLYGKINEDIHEGISNVNLEDMGLILVTKDLERTMRIINGIWEGIRLGSCEMGKLL